ncbi:PAAR domain-containing protein [Enterobacter cloacae]|uniref:PAAR domain-containing protein n=1 Tax=Enterobacter cloacae TaxID=550 RepID=UPI0009B2E263
MHTVDRAAMVVTGHKFNCLQCGKEATLIESSHVTVNGQRRVLHGDKTTCGAKVNGSFCRDTYTWWFACHRSGQDKSPRRGRHWSQCRCG